MEDFQIIDSLIASGDFNGAFKAVDERILALESDQWHDALLLAQLYFTRGKLYWRLGNRPKATSDYATASHLDPTSPATQALAQAREIEDFFNHDLYNP